MFFRGGADELSVYRRRKTDTVTFPLMTRTKKRLYARGTRDWVRIILTDGKYPETVVCEFRNGIHAEFKQVSPTLYELQQIKDEEDTK